MKVSVIDIGSNTIKATLFKISSSGAKSVIGHRGHKARLAEYVVEDNSVRMLSAQGVEKLYSCIEDLTEFSFDRGCSHIHAFATASLRNLVNAEEIANEVMHRFSLSIDILSGEQEAMCSLRGLLSDGCADGIKEGIMIDMGGGSTEIVRFANGREPQAVSLPFGCLSLYKSFVTGKIPSDGELGAIEEYVSAELNKCSFVHNLGVPLFLIGGSARAVMKVINGKSLRTSLCSDGSDFAKTIEKFKQHDFFESAEKIVPGRSLTVTPAAAAYRIITEFIKPVSITVSDSGVREGYLEKILP